MWDMPLCQCNSEGKGGGGGEGSLLFPRKSRIFPLGRKETTEIRKTGYSNYRLATMIQSYQLGKKFKRYSKSLPTLLDSPIAPQKAQVLGRNQIQRKSHQFPREILLTLELF